MESSAPGRADWSPRRRPCSSTSSWYKTSLPPKIELIQIAIEQHRTLRFAYFSPREESVRTVEPYYLVFHWSAWYLWGWCRTREDFRLFIAEPHDGARVR